jgi:hypothetical protein
MRRVSALLLLAMLALAGPAQAVPRVVFTDGTYLEVERAWADDKYVHYIYDGRQITVLRSDVARIEGAQPGPDKYTPPVTSACPALRAGDDERAIREYFRCVNVRWTRSAIAEDKQELWVYQGWVRGQLEKYVVRDGRVIRSQVGN